MVIGLYNLPKFVKDFVIYYKELTTPDNVYMCNGSPEEKQALTEMLLKVGTLAKLPKYDNCYIAKTFPGDVARVESKTYMCTPEKNMSVPIPLDDSKGQLGNWANDKEMKEKLTDVMKDCMEGRTMYLMVFCMGPLGSPYSKIGVQLTDSPYVVLSMGVMTTMGSQVLPYLKEDFIKCVHSVCQPLPLDPNAPEAYKTWPCNPEKTMITQFPLTNEIISVGSGYGGNSLLGKKCFALRLAGNLAKKEGWFAEHMLIMGLQNSNNEKIYVAAAFPSACGKTNLAMITPTIPGWKITCVGDDIAWMHFNDKDGKLYAINPEKGFFGVAPGTSRKTNPIAMQCIFKDTIFTNVATTSDGGVFWEGLENEIDFNRIKITDWLGNENWTPESGTKAAHPNSRFCAPIRNCPILDSLWDSKNGVPIDAIIFGGRRPTGIPLVYESFSWNHGVFIGAGMKSETTAAASDMKSNVITHDPFAMRPFLGYNAGDYFKHWFTLGSSGNRTFPHIFHVNWFLKDEQGKFVWPGFGENLRVLEWIFKRCKGNEDIMNETSIGYVPKIECMNLDGLNLKNPEQMLKVDKEFFKSEIEELDGYFKHYLNQDYPKELQKEVDSLRARLQ